MFSGRSRTRSMCVLALAILPLGACATVAGIGGLEVDPCFDGCGDSGPDGPKDLTSADAGPDVLLDSGTDGPADAACLCPTGTVPINNVCVMTVAGGPSSHCVTPMQLPDCALKVSLKICDTDPTFHYQNPPSGTGCAEDGGDVSLPSAFVRLGTAPAGKTWATHITGPYYVAQPDLSCTVGGFPCAGGGLVSTVFNLANVADQQVTAIGKQPSATGCQDVLFEAALP